MGAVGIGSNRQGTSLTVKDLIAMSRIKDCLSGALLFVKEVVIVMISIVAGQLDMIVIIIIMIKITALATCSTFMYTTRACPIMDFACVTIISGGCGLGQG